MKPKLWMTWAALSVWCYLASGLCGEDFNDLLPSTESAPKTRLVYQYLQGQAERALQRRNERFEKLDTAEAIQAYQQEQRKFFQTQLGGFPERTPLESRVVGKLAGDGYTIEKVIFASQPNHHVTANMYLPETAPPYPCVVVASGHSRTAKAADYNQRFGIIMAKNGMAALVYDPIGQGERSMILNAAGEAKHNSTTAEHFQIGVGSILLGTNTARYRVWDAMRAIDYAQSREDVIAARIGFTGCSGGGTVTSYVMALDDRVRCAAPACYLTTFGQLISSIGPQDAEQNIYGQIRFGMDHPDYVLMRAPQPTIISCTTNDYFGVEGVWQNFRQAKRIYTRLGYGERVGLVEGDGNHGVPLGNLNAIMRWMRRWLLDQDDAAWTDQFVTRTPEELQCTPAGQVLQLAGEISVYELNARRQRSYEKQRAQFAKLDPSEQRRQMRQLLNMSAEETLPKLAVTEVGSVRREGQRCDKVIYQAPDQLPIPAVVCYPRQNQRRVCLYVSGQGKQAALQDRQLQERLADGQIVVAVDLPGIGETRDDRANAVLGDWKNFYVAYLLGKPYVGLRAEVILQLAQRLEKDFPDQPVELVATGEAATAALHAAALSDHFTRVELKDALESWVPIVSAIETENQLVNTIHGVLGHYDLPRLTELHGNVHYVKQAKSTDK